MKSSNFFKVFIGLVAIVISLACGALAGAPATAIPSTAIPPTAILPTNTPAAPRPTSTPRPTATPELPPTPAQVGELVSSSSFEATVISARELTRVYMGNYYYYPLENQIYVEVVAKVVNLTGSDASIPWNNVYVVESTGDAWYPNWVGYKATETGKKVDGSTIGVNDSLDGSATIDFEQDVYLRMIWFLNKQDKTVILFGFADTPNVEIVIE